MTRFSRALTCVLSALIEMKSLQGKTRSFSISLGKNSKNSIWQLDNQGHEGNPTILHHLNLHFYFKEFHCKILQLFSFRTKLFELFLILFHIFFFFFPVTSSRKTFFFLPFYSKHKSKSKASPRKKFPFINVTAITNDTVPVWHNLIAIAWQLRETKKGFKH